MTLFPKDWARAVNRASRYVPPWLVYLSGAGWAGWLFWLGLTGGLGPEPINALERAYGEVALQILIAVLLVSPLRDWTGINLVRYRRALGVTAFFFVLAHFLVWVFLDLRNVERLVEEVLKRPYITIGFIGFVLLIPLAVTSNNVSIRKLGAAGWKRLHRLTYPAVLLGAVHYVWLVKGYPAEPFIYLALVLVLLALRISWPRVRQVFA